MKNGSLSRPIVAALALAMLAACAPAAHAPPDPAGTGGDASSGSGGSTAGTGGLTGAGAGGTGSGAGGAGAGDHGTGGMSTATDAGAGGPLTDAGADRGGTGGAGAGGAGGAPVDPNLEVVRMAFDGFRYEFPCIINAGGQPVDPNSCNIGEICWRRSTSENVIDRKTIMVPGDANTTYEITVRIRGVLEPRDYPASCGRLPNQPANTIGVVEQCDGFANRGSVTFNVYELKFTNPEHVYYLNAVPIHPPHRVDPIDFTWKVRAKGQSMVGFTMNDLNGGEIRNCSIVVSGIPPAPSRFDGNFFQLNVAAGGVIAVQ
jgi:hypothetical protein